MTRGIAGGLAALLLAVSLGAAVSGAAGASPELSAGPGEPGPWGDAAPERWIVGNETLENIVQDVGQRWRVLPGARLSIQNSTLRFQAVPAGLTGLVAEPGSEVRVVNSVLESAQPGAFLVHLEGASLIEGSRILGALRVVLQPRSVTDHGDDALGPHLEGLALGWRVLRAHTAGIAKLARSTIEAEGPGLVLGVPEQYQVLVPEPAAVPVPVVVEKSTVRAAGPGVVCYVTRQQPDPDATSLLAEALARKVPAGLTFPDVQVEAREGPALHCPPQPTAYTLPRRNVPAGAPPELGLLQPHLPAPPAPEAVAGLGSVKWLGGRIAGGGAGVVVDTPAQVQLWGPRFEGLAGAVRVAHEKASVELVNPSGSGLAQGLEVTAGALDVEGGVLAGSGAGVGLRVLGGSVFVQRLALQGFALGASLEAPADLVSVRFRDMPMCALVRSGATIDRAVFDRCGDGVVLDRATGAAVWGSSFVDNLDPLRVESPDAEANPQHFDHFVANNRVNGKPLVYLFRAKGVNRDGAGHVVVAHSSDVRVGQVDISFGNWHVYASDNVVLGPLTNQQPLVLQRINPSLAQLFRQIWLNVRFEMYPGALKGPLGAEQQAAANDLDQAWLLAEKLQALGYSTRLSKGYLFTQPVAFLNWTGFKTVAAVKGVTGCSCSILETSPPTIVRDHTWLELKIEPGVWLELDPSFVQYDWTPAWSPPKGTLPDVTTWLPAIGSDGAATVPYGQVDLDFNNLISSVREQVGSIEGIEQSALPLTGGPQPRLVERNEEPRRQPVARYHQIPEADKWTVTVNSFDPAIKAPGGMQFQATTADLYAKRVSIIGASATEADQQILEANGGLLGLDRRSVRLVNELWVGGQLAARHDKPLFPGDKMGLSVVVNLPGGERALNYANTLHTGGVYAVVIDVGRTPIELPLKELETYNESLTRALGGAQPSKEELSTPLMQVQGWYYFANVHFARGALLASVYDQPLVGLALTGFQLTPVLNGTREEVLPLPPFIDVRSVMNAYPRDGNVTRGRAYDFLSGAIASLWEGHIFTMIYNATGVSTASALGVATQEGQPIYTIDDASRDLLSKTNLTAEAKEAILSAVEQGRSVVVHDAPLNIGTWTGIAWIEVEPQTGASAWMILGAAEPPLGTGTVEVFLLAGGSAAGPRDGFDVIGTLEKVLIALNIAGAKLVSSAGQNVVLAVVSLASQILSIENDYHRLGTHNVPRKAVIDLAFADALFIAWWGALTVLAAVTCFSGIGLPICAIMTALAAVISYLYSKWHTRVTDGLIEEARRRAATGTG